MDSFAWPLAVVIVTIVFMIIFRHPISALLARTKKVGKGGLEAFEAPQVPASAAAKKDDALAEFMDTYHNPLVKEQETIIEDDLVQRGFTDCEDSRKALIRSLATAQLLHLFEVIQNTIWASQVNALTYLNSRPNGIAGMSEIRPFFDLAVKQYPDWYTTMTMESWLEFMESWVLIIIDNDMVGITVRGREFLKWRVESGRAGPYHG